MGNSRIRTIAPGLEAERVSESTHIGYDPIEAGAAITFVAPEYMIDADGTAIVKLGTPPDILRAGFSDIATRKFGASMIDPVTGHPLDNVSTAGIALLVKRAYDVLHNERAAALAALTGGA